MVVLPAASSPTMRMRISFFEKRRLNSELRAQATSRGLREQAVITSTMQQNQSAVIKMQPLAFPQGACTRPPVGAAYGGVSGYADKQQILVVTHLILRPIATRFCFPSWVCPESLPFADPQSSNRLGCLSPGPELPRWETQMVLNSAEYSSVLRSEELFLAFLCFK